MTRILVIETASPKRVREKIGQILESGTYPDPKISVLCNEKNTPEYRDFSGTRIIAAAEGSSRRVLRRLAGERFDVVFCFWTGVGRGRRWKLLPVRLKARATYILSGDGNEFRLTWKAICRHSIFRLRHPLPTDYQKYEVGPKQVLVIQSAEPPYILRGLERLEKDRLFTSPTFTLFCRNRPETVEIFQGSSLLNQILPHSEARNSWDHLMQLRRGRFDAVVLFLTGDPSYWKVKLFAFMLGVRRILIFNEFNDCFFFNFHQWLALVSSGIQTWSGQTGSKWSHSFRVLLSLTLKLVSLPFRFVWLILVWLRLRVAGLISSGEGHDYPV